MKIVRVELFRLCVPLAVRMAMAGRLFDTAETVVIRLVTDDGLVGHGEAASSPYLTGETTPGIIAAAELIANSLLGSDPRDLRPASLSIARSIAGNTGTKAGFDMALHDLAGKAGGVPVYQLLGGRVCDSQPGIVLIGSGDPRSTVEAALARQREGYRLFKLKAANASLDDDIETMLALRAALGPDALISADANGAWSPGQARQFLSQVARMNPQFVEQPLAESDLDGVAELIGQTSIPIGLDESLHGLGDIKRLARSPGIAGFSLKILKFGALSETANAFGLCRRLGLGVNMSGKVGETGIANAAALQVALACGEANWGFSATNQYLVTDVVDDPLRIEAGLARARETPGLGIEVSQDTLEKYLVPDDGAKAPIVRELSHVSTRKNKKLTV